MHLRYGVTALIVQDVPATVTFYARAFGLELHYMHPSNGYAELDTRGSTLLAFLSESFLSATKLLGSLPIHQNRADLDPAGAMIALVTERIKQDWSRAVEAGATVVKEPEEKPWGQTVGYLRDLDGVIVELCTPSLPPNQRSKAAESGRP
jgi:uncharacterized glyoxalase superfamily protein PhnB